MSTIAKHFYIIIYVGLNVCHLFQQLLIGVKVQFYKENSKILRLSHGNKLGLKKRKQARVAQPYKCFLY